MSPRPQTPTRRWIHRAFSAVEDVVCIGLSILLAGVAIALLVSTFLSFIVELGILTLMIIALAISLYFLHRRDTASAVPR